MSRSPRDSPQPPAAPAALAVWPRLAPALQPPQHQREDSTYSDDADHAAGAAAGGAADADEDRSDSESTSVAPPPVPALPSQPFPSAVSSSLSPAALRAQRYFAGMADADPAPNDGSSDDGHASDEDDQGDFLSPEAAFGRPRGARIGAFKDGLGAGGSDSDEEYHLSDSGGGGDDDSNGDESSMIMHSRNRLGHHQSFSQSQLEHFLSPPPAAAAAASAAPQHHATPMAPLGPPIARGQVSQLQPHPNGSSGHHHAAAATSGSYVPSAVAVAAASSAAVAADGSRRYPLPPGPSPHSSPQASTATAAFPPHASHPAAAPPSNRTLGQLHAASHSSASTATAAAPHPPPKPVLSPAQHREDVSTLDYYLRQALASKDYAALHDLVARANEQHLSSELIGQARSILLDKRAEDVSAEIGTLMHYMRASIDARSKDACIESLKKAESLAHSLQSGPHRRLYANFFERVEECRKAVDEFEREDAQTVSVYLRQGTQLRSREVLQAALTKATSVRHSLLDQSILAQAKALLTELDSQVMLRNFLTLAIRNRDPLALEDTISQAGKLNLKEKDAPELAEARRLADELRLNPHLAGVGAGAAGAGTPGAGGTKGDKSEKQRLRDAEKERERDRERAEKEAQKALDRAEKERQRAEKDALRSAEKERKAEAALALAQSEAAAAGEEQKEKTQSHAKIKEKLSWFGSGGGSASKKKKGGASKEAAASAAAAANGNTAHKLFGGSLSLAISRNPSGTGVPRIVEDCASFLRSSGALDEPGLFRVAGNKDAIDALRAGYEANYDATNPAPPPPPALTEIHDVSGLFKLYFRLLPEPLIPWDMYDRFVKVGLNRGEGRVEAMKELAAMLPRDNFVLLSYLFSFLFELSQHVALTKMSPDNLAIVFAPNLIRPKIETPQSMMTEMPSTISVISTFISECNTIFGPGAGAGAGI